MSNSSVLTVSRIVASTSSSTLASLKGSALDSSMQAIMLVPADSSDTIYWNTGVASASSARLPASGISLPINKALADTIQLYAESKALCLVELA